MLQPSSLYVTAALMVSPEGSQDRNRMPAIKQSTAAATPRPTPLMVHPEETQDEKAQDTGPR